jgi:hypothetical protein
MLKHRLQFTSMLQTKISDQPNQNITLAFNYCHCGKQRITLRASLIQSKDLWDYVSENEQPVPLPLGFLLPEFNSTQYQHYFDQNAGKRVLITIYSQANFKAPKFYSDLQDVR